MRCPALFLPVVAVLSGCLIIDDSQPPPGGAEVLDLQHRKLFEVGRRAEFQGDGKIAGDTYGWLVERGSRYGEYGLAMLLLRREPGSREAVKLLLSCAKHSSHTPDLFPDPAMESAFSVAAMAKLSEIVAFNHGRPEIAASLRSEISGLVTPEVRAWADQPKADPDSAAIYGDVISAVESARQSRENMNVFKWDEICKVFLSEEPDRE